MMAPESPLDVVVIGGGVAGLAAAASAGEQLGSSGRVLLLEKAPAAEAGGNTRWTDAYFRLKDIYEPADGFVEDMLGFSRGRTDRAYVEALVERLPEAMEWVQSHGVRFHRRPTYFVTASRPRLMPVGGGESLVHRLTEACEKAQVRIRYGAPATRIERTAGGYRVTWSGTDDGEDAVDTRTIVVACGGFEGEPERLRRHLGEAGARMKTIAPGGRFNTGEVIDQVLALGARASGEWANFHGEPVDARSTQPEASVMIFSYGILVDRNGRRFFDEGAGTVDETYEDCARAILALPDSRAALVADAKMLDVPGIERGLLTDKKPIRADTLDALAEEMRVDAGGLRATVDEYNAAIVPGPFDPSRPDGLHTRGLAPEKSNWAQPIEEPPFLGIPLVTDIVFTYGGIATDADARVLDRSGAPMPGLYAAGECTGIYHHKYPGATSVMRGLVFGRVSGIAAAREAGGCVGDDVRLPRVLPDDLDEDQRDLYETFVGGPRQTQAGFFPVADAEGVLSGPYRAMLESPAAGRPLERLGRAVRYELALPDRVRELAILTVARVQDSDVEWQAHERLALSVGVPEETVESLRAGDPTFTDEADAEVYRFARQLLEDHRVDDAAFAAVQQRYGRAGLFELIATIGYYQIIAHINNAYGLRAAQPVLPGRGRP